MQRASFNSLENCDDTPLRGDRHGEGGVVSSWSSQDTRCGVFPPACPETGGQGLPNKTNWWETGLLRQGIEISGLGAAEARGLGACHPNPVLSTRCLSQFWQMRVLLPATTTAQRQNWVRSSWKPSCLGGHNLFSA